VSQFRVADSTVTPEAVRLHVDVSGLGSRMIAWLVDALIQVSILIPLFIAATAVAPGGTVELVIGIVILFGVIWLYFPLFEWLGNGRTPGKRAQRIRVVRTDGQPAGFARVMVRNLIRIVDVYALPFLAVISMIVTRRAQRLGDLAAGTMVVRDRKVPTLKPLELGELDEQLMSALDTSGLTERDYALIRSFLSRRDGLDLGARQQLAGRVVASIQPRLGGSHMNIQAGDERLLQAVARSYRARFSREERET
jgi:uncharacterized RDD family membrane protein YckC